MTKYLGVGRIQNAEIWNMALYRFWRKYSALFPIQTDSYLKNVNWISRKAEDKTAKIGVKDF